MFTKIVRYHPDFGGYWDAQPLEFGTNISDAGASNLGCVRCTLVFSRTTPAATREDQVMTTLHLAVNPGGSVFVPPADLTQLALTDTALDAFKTALLAMMSNQFTAVEWRYHLVDADKFKIKDGSYWDVLGPAFKVRAITGAGVSPSARIADQVSATYTLKTASRKHWGRGYIPGLGNTNYDTTYGRLTTASADGIATAVRTLGNSLAALSTSYELGVWSPRGRAFLTTTEIQVDNVPDIQRRRRAKQSSYKKTFVS